MDYERRAKFIRWATDRLDNGFRYAVVDRSPCPGIGWARVDVSGKEVDESGGAFYDDVPEHPEGAIEWAISSAKSHAEKMRCLLEDL